MIGVYIFYGVLVLIYFIFLVQLLENMFFFFLYWVQENVILFILLGEERDSFILLIVYCFEIGVE